MGSVHPPALKVLEVGCFILAMLWAARLATLRQGGLDAPLQLPPGTLPLCVLLAFFVLQGVALPPRALRAISAETYRFYSMALPGWPQREPYTQLQLAASKASSEITRKGEGFEGDVRSAGVLWYPISLAPSLTRSAAVEAFAWAAGFVAIVAFPFASEGEKRRFEVRVLRAILVSGVLVAALGILGRVYWNGKILWFFVSQDWGGPVPANLPRASGPFVNPDHFANFLAMVFPLTVAGTMFGTPRRSNTERLPVQLLSGCASVVLLAGLLLSLSRAAWLGTILGMIVFTVILATRSSELGLERAGEAQGSRKQRSKIPVRRLHVPRFRWILQFGRSWLLPLVFGLLVLFALLVVGSPGTDATQARIAQSVDNGGLGARSLLWRDSLAIFRHFPVMGIGLGAWPGIFPHFQSGPWSSYFFREAHNDYLQFLGEAGALGAVLLILLVASIGRAIARARIASRDLPIFAALLAGISAMVFHEFFDFSLRIPANAFLCAILIALTVRLGLPRSSETTRVGERQTRFYAFAGSLSLFAVVLAFVALTCDQRSYPYNIPYPRDLRSAGDTVRAYPLNASPHLALANLLNTEDLEILRLQEMAIAVWLDPLNPYSRDAYARLLIAAGRPQQALVQVEKSVFNAPDPGFHPYLTEPLLRWTTPDEQRAIERGYREAIAAGYPDGVQGLGIVYDRLGRYADEAQLYASAAHEERDAAARASFFESAGEVYVSLRETNRAEEALRAAVTAAPTDSEPYERLATQIYGPAHKLDLAQELIELGVDNGADPVALYSSLGTAAQDAGDAPMAEKAWLKALAYQPSFEMTQRVGEFYLESGKADLAIKMLQRASEMDPQSAQTYFMLGEAQEAAYQYSDAEKSYGQAAALSQTQFGSAYAAFRRRMSTGGGNT
jgi:O-antigen ligase/tetratricopeptide (TPR) repeat protein